MFNRIWSGDEIPQKWRTAIIKPLLKDGKDPGITTSYRPISLTACLGKLLEKIVVDRLNHLLEEKGLLNENQAGFRRNRCTTDQVLKLVQMATDKIQSKGEGSATIVTFFDFEKAYDKVWREGLLHKMIQMNIPHRYIQYVRHFLSARQTTVDVNGVKCTNFYLNEGLPQGSAISPLLFLIFIKDIDEEITMHTTTSLFADDTSVWVTAGKDKEEARRNMQEAIKGIERWARKWKMSLNESKTEAIVISSSRTDNTWKPILNLNGKEAKIVSSYKFLGVVVDNGLRFSEHVRKTVNKGKKRTNILRCMTGKDWGQKLETQRKLYMTYIRSTLEYASPSWYPWISETEKGKLERIQNQGLRTIVGLSKTCPVEFLNLEANVEPLKTRMKKNDMIT